MYNCFACRNEIEHPGETCPICGFPVIHAVSRDVKEEEQIRKFAEEYKIIHPEFFSDKKQHDTEYRSSDSKNVSSGYKINKYKQYTQELEKKYEELLRYINQLQTELNTSKEKEKKLKKRIKTMVIGIFVPVSIAIAYILASIIMGNSILPETPESDKIIAEDSGENVTAGSDTTNENLDISEEKNTETDIKTEIDTKTEINTESEPVSSDAAAVITETESATGLLIEKLINYLVDSKYSEIIQSVDSEEDNVKNDEEIINIYNTAVSRYRDEITDEAEKAFQSGGYEQALVIVNEGLSVLGDDAYLLAVKSQYEAMAAVEADSTAAEVSLVDSYEIATARKYGSQRYIAAGYEFAVGIKTDGTCVAAGEDAPDVSGWDDITAVSAFGRAAAGLRTDGTVVCSDDRLNVEEWDNITQIEYCSKVERTIKMDPSEYHLLGLAADGTVVAAGTNNYGECDVSGWNNIVDVAAGCAHSVGLRADGTVVACGSNENGQCNVSGWNDIVDVAAARFATYGLTADGKILVTGSLVSAAWGEDYVLEVPQWNHVAAIIACNDIGNNKDFVIGIRTDGTIVSNRTDYLDYLNQSDIESFSDVQSVAASSWGFIMCSDSSGNVKAAGADDVKMEDINTWPAIQSP